MVADLPPPPGWSIRTVWNPTPARTGLRGFYWAYCLQEERVILLLPRWWAAPVWPLIRRFALRHELGHAWGIPAAGCLDGHPWCVMAEERLAGYPDGSWKGKLKLLWHQLTDRRGRGRFCPECEQLIRGRMQGAGVA